MGAKPAKKRAASGPRRSSASASRKSVSRPKAVAKKKSATRAPKKKASAKVGKPGSGGKLVPSSRKATGAKSTSARSRRSTTRSAGPAPTGVAAKKKKKVAIPKRLAPLRRKLLERQRELMQAYANSKGDSRDRLDDGTEDYIDYAVTSYAKEFILSLTEMDRKQLQLVEEALRRMERGEYGVCQQCGQEIPQKRLEVVPWVRHCVRCQELEEQGLLPQTSFADAVPEEDDDLVDDEDYLDEDEDEDEDEADDDEADEEDEEDEDEDSTAQTDAPGVDGESEADVELDNDEEE